MVVGRTCRAWFARGIRIDAAPPSAAGCERRWCRPWFWVVALLSSCSSQRPVAEAPLVGRALPAPPPTSAFVPLEARAQRKAKLLELAPRIDELYRARMVELGVTGAAVGIVLEGEIVYARGFGVRDLESKSPVDEHTRFRLGSVSKTITALAIMRLPSKPAGSAPRFVWGV